MSETHCHKTMQRQKSDLKKWDYVFFPFFSEVTNVTFLKITFTKLETP